VELFASVFVARAYIDDLVDRNETTASEFFFLQIDGLLSRSILAFHAQPAERRGRVPAFFKVGVVVCLILELARLGPFRPLHLEDQSVLVLVLVFGHVECDPDIVVSLKEDPGETVSALGLLAIVCDRGYSLRCILNVMRMGLLTLTLFGMAYADRFVSSSSLYAPPSILHLPCSINSQPFILSTISEDVAVPCNLDAGSGQSEEAAIPYSLHVGSGQRSLQSRHGSNDSETEVRNCDLLKDQFPRPWTTVLTRFPSKDTLK